MLVLKHNPRHGFTAVLAATEEFHIRPAAGTADHRQEGRGQDVVPRRQPGPFHSGIFDLVEEVHRGDGGTGGSGHEGALRSGGRQLQYTPSPTSNFMNAVVQPEGLADESGASVATVRLKLALGHPGSPARQHQGDCTKLGIPSNINLA